MKNLLINLPRKTIPKLCQNPVFPSLFLGKIAQNEHGLLDWEYVGINLGEGVRLYTSVENILL
jgi:hypothetical protein